MTAFDKIKEALKGECEEEVAEVEKWLTFAEFMLPYVILVGDFEYTQDAYTTPSGELYVEDRPLITQTEVGGAEKIALIRELKGE